MTEEARLRDFARAILDEQEDRLAQREDKLVRAAVVASLAAWGIDADDEDELREIKADRIHNRKWRKSVELATQVTIRTAVTTIVTGFVGAILLALKIKLGSNG